MEGTLGFELGPAPILPGAPPITDTHEAGAAFQVPSVAGGGLAWRSRGGRVTLAAEVDHAGYEGLLQADDAPTNPYPNAWEYHVGAEYALLRTTPIIAFRAGSWIEKNQGEFGTTDLTHLSAGIGIAARMFQIDLAADLSDEVDTASLSFIYNF